MRLLKKGGQGSHIKVTAVCHWSRDLMFPWLLLPKFGVFSLIFREISPFYEEFLAKPLQFLHPYILFDFFKSHLKNVCMYVFSDISEQFKKSKMADIFKVWRYFGIYHNRFGIVTKINMFECLQPHKFHF